MKKFFTRVFCVLTIFLSRVMIASAQWTSASSEMTTIQTELKTMTSTIINILSIVIGLIGVGSLAMAYAKHTKGDPSAADALTKVGFGLVIVIILMQIIKMTLLS